MNTILKDESLIQEMRSFNNKEGNREFDKNFICSFSKVVNNTVTKHNQQVCHVTLPLNKPIGFSSTIKNNCGNEKLYYNFLFDREISPWRHAIGEYEFTYDENEKLTGFIIKDTNKSIFLLMNLVIATRIPWEHPGVYKTWLKLVEEYGVEYRIALLFSVMFYVRDNNITDFNFISHSSFDGLRDNFDPRKVYSPDKEFFDSHLTMLQTSTYRPCNTTCWHSRRNIVEKYKKIFNEHFSSYKTKEKGVYTWQEDMIRWSIPFDLAVEKLIPELYQEVEKND